MGEKGDDVVILLVILGRWKPNSFNPFTPELAKTGRSENTSLFLNQPKPALENAFVLGFPPHPKGQIWTKQMYLHCSQVIGQSYYEYCE